MPAVQLKPQAVIQICIPFVLLYSNVMSESWEQGSPRTYIGATEISTVQHLFPGLNTAHLTNTKAVV